MRKKLIVFSLLILCLIIQVRTEDLDDDDIFEKFINYTNKVYMANARQSLDSPDFMFYFDNIKMSARLLGYSLGNLLQYARRASDNHKIWLMLEKKVKENIFSKIDKEGKASGWEPSFTENRKQKAWQECMASQQGWFNAEMALKTNVNQYEAPNFFDTLTADDPDVPEPPTPPQPPKPPAPPQTTIWDAVAGSYIVTGRDYDNDPRHASLVTLSGSMQEVEAEFKLFFENKVTWDYKGTAKWDGREPIRNSFDLTGSIHPVKYPYNQHGLSIRIMLGDDNSWRASSINIGGNAFALQQTQGTSPKEAYKSLTIMNTTALNILVYLDDSPGEAHRMLGSVNAQSKKTFTDIPARGRYYVTIYPPPDTNLKSHNFTLYIKEAQFAYYFEVKDSHFR